MFICSKPRHAGGIIRKGRLGKQLVGLLAEMIELPRRSSWDFLNATKPEPTRFVMASFHPDRLASSCVRVWAHQVSASYESFPERVSSGLKRAFLGRLTLPLTVVVEPVPVR